MGYLTDANRRKTLAKRAFTLAEMLFAFGIASILLAMTFINLQSTVTKKEGPRGLAHALASDIRAARAEAQKTGRLVAVCFPSEGKSNSLSRSVAIRKGDQRGELSKVISYESQFQGTIFLGRWEHAEVPKVSGTLPDSWEISLTDELALVFRPDGTAFSQDLTPIAGRFPILVASSFEGSMNGPEARLSHTTNPNTVWVSSSGGVEVDENSCPVGRLPESEVETNPPVAQLKLNSEPRDSAPTLVSAVLLPEKIEALETANIGQNFVSIHPDDKLGQYLEYGMASIELKVEDSDGGPLHYRVSALATEGEGGDFAVPDQKGSLRYAFDPGLNKYVWQSLIVWRPPPGAATDITYELKVEVIDPDGHVLEVNKEGVALSVTSLPPSRLVVATTDDYLYLANPDGANEIHISKDGPEYTPFFSADGSQIFSFCNEGGATELRRRIASGTNFYKSLCTFTGTSAQVEFDPTFTFAAITSPAGTRDFSWGRVDSDTTTTVRPDGTVDRDTDYDFVDGSSEVAVNEVFILNLMSGEAIPVSNNAANSLAWNIQKRHAFFYEDVVPTEFSPSTSHAPGPYRLYPGHFQNFNHKRLVGYPSQQVDTGPPLESATGKIINPANRTWYLEIVGSELRLKNDVLGVSQLVDSSAGGFEYKPYDMMAPAWSGEGDRVAYVKLGATNEVVTKRLLAQDLSQVLSPFLNQFSASAPGLSSAKLSPKGRWVYFLRGDVLMRAENQSGSPQIDISSHLGKGIKSYALSP